MAQALQRVGKAVHVAKKPFAVVGKEIPAGSFVVFAAQAFRPHVRDLFEPQFLPADFNLDFGVQAAKSERDVPFKPHDQGVQFIVFSEFGLTIL